ncbi:MAG: hypothetical protein BA866_09050 [Desulfobulbaceae bacterium S5133MH15]|nr:MAG: hypothetical protein BA866_09050 [Desulfobulbaceae bacterium S5133MH15]OEU83084.1 MAG: hypothetical protein BA873_00710 [Desulfobulbaceae bacterium C00003063]
MIGRVIFLLVVKWLKNIIFSFHVSTKIVEEYGTLCDFSATVMPAIWKEKYSDIKGNTEINDCFNM